MIRITLIVVGKIKEKYWNDAIAEYSKRLSRYCKLDIIEVQDEKTPDDAPAAICDQIKKKEGERILKNIDDHAFVCTLDSLNHIEDREQLLLALSRVSLFLEPDGVFVFDMNTLYKHERILADNAFVYEQEQEHRSGY